MFNKEGKGNGSVSLIKTFSFPLTTRGCLIHPTLESTTTNTVSNARTEGRRQSSYTCIAASNGKNAISGGK